MGGLFKLSEALLRERIGIAICGSRILEAQESSAKLGDEHRR